jgi:hypothetical protein
MPSDEHRLWQDERAADRRERDRHREPTARFPSLRADPSPEPSTVRLSCPCCRGSVYALSYSADEALTCLHCGVELVTRQSIGGLVEVVERSP